MSRKITVSVDREAAAELRRLGGLLKHLYPKTANWSADEKKRYWAGYETLLAVAKRIDGES